MAFKKNIKLVLVVLVLLGVGAVYVGGQQLAAYTTQQFYLIPSWGSADCRAGQILPFGPWGIPTDLQRWGCGYEDVNANVKQCSYSIETVKSTYGLGNVIPSLLGKPLLLTYKCTAQGQCTQISSGTTANIPLNRGEYISTKKNDFFGNPYGVGDARISATAQTYDLVLTGSDGRKDIVANGCSLPAYAKSLVSNVDASKLQSGNIVPFGQAVNWIGFYQPAYDVADIIDGSVVGVSGKIYVVAPGAYYKMLGETIAGYTVVDSSQIFRDSRLQCRPEQKDICTADAKLKTASTPVGSQCSPTAGVDPGYHLIGNQKCTLRCVGGSTATDQCQTLQQCGLDEKYDANFNCVKITSVGKFEKRCVEGEFKVSSSTCLPNWIPIILILGVVLIMVVVTIVVITGRRR